MDEGVLLQQRLRENERRNEALQTENESLRSQVASLRASFEQVVAEFATFRHDHEALIDATRVLTGERDLLQKRAVELEAVNKRLVDMLWGRRSERRSDSPDQMQLAFAVDPPGIERRERVIDLSEEEKKGLKPIGVKVTERLRFEKPHVYVEVLKRPQYVVAGQPAEGVRSAPPPLSIVEGCKYDFSVIAAVGAMKFIHASCNAHARREFVKAESNDPILASQGISFYRQLYDVEERGKTLDAAARRELRQRDAVPIWNRMERWLAGDAANRALPRSAIGEALGYLRNQWPALRVYLGDGNVPIDNDQSERTIRPLVVGRGNWLFLGRRDCGESGRCGLRGIVARIHSTPAGIVGSWRCGLRGIVARIHFPSFGIKESDRCGLRGIVARIHSGEVAAPIPLSCGLRGIVARIH